MIRSTLLALGLSLMACGATAGPAASDKASDKPQAAKPLEDGQAEAIIAAGCFWCSESDFEKVPGVIDAVSGYAGGHTDHPTYYQVGSGATGHTEALRVIYDPGQVTYEELLDYYWRHVDPFDPDGQFCDQGTQYRPALMPVNAEQKAKAKASITEIEGILGKSVAVKIEDPGTFWVAEEYHQDFYKKNPAHYHRYRLGCGRDRAIQKIWADVKDPKARPGASH